jgi:protein NrfD
VILYFFLSNLGVGIVLTLALVSREAGVKFFRFNAGLAAILIAVAIAFRPAGDAGALATAGFIALLLAEAAIIVYWATVGRMLARIRPAIAGTAIVAGVIALAAHALGAAEGRGATAQALAVASFFSSAALLGGTCTAMILGHWYLILPSMPVSHLQRIVKFHMASLVIRILVVGLAVLVAFATWQPEMGPSFRYYISSFNGIFFWMRVLFGLAAPVLLSYLTWETAKIQSTQSATGILYVDLFTVIVGEVLAVQVFLEKGVPL